MCSTAPAKVFETTKLGLKHSQVALCSKVLNGVPAEKIHQSSTKKEAPSGSARLVHITTHFKSKKLTSSLEKLLQGNQATGTSADYLGNVCLQACMPAGYLGCFLRLPSSNPISWSQHGALQEHSGLLLLRLACVLCISLYHIFVRLFDKDQCCVLDLRFAN